MCLPHFSASLFIRLNISFFILTLYIYRYSLIDNVSLEGDRIMIEQAKAFAEKAHKNHFRKISKEPYITHPIRVAKRLKEAGCSEDVIAAAYLHDVVEDTPYKMADISDHFGETVAELVAGHTENKSLSWQKRKQHTIDSLEHADSDIKKLIVADRLDNLLDLKKDLNQYGETVWDFFNAGYSKQKWYNEAIVNHMYDNISEDAIPDFFSEFEDAVADIFNENI